VSTLIHDLRYSLRALARSPVISAILLVSVGLGTGANAVVFSLVNALLFRAPAGVSRPGSLVSVFTSQFSGSRYGPSSYPDYLSLKADSGTFSALAAIDDDASVAVPLGDAIGRVRVASVSGNFFSTLGLRPAAGRLLTDGDEQERQAAVIAFTFWQRAFDSNESVVGQPLTLRGRAYTIVGIAPPDFDGLRLGRPCDVWIPLPAGAQSGPRNTPAPSATGKERANRRLALVGRLKDGVTIDAARQRIDAIARALSNQYPDTNRGTAAGAQDSRSMSVTRYSRIDPALRTRVTLLSVVLFGATLLVLLSACANAGGLMLSRATARGREIAVRFALGATRGDVIRLLLTESFVVSIGAAAIGVMLAVWTLNMLMSSFAPEQAEMLDTQLNQGAFTLTFAVAVAAGAAFGLAPALQVTREESSAALRGDGSVTSDGRGGTRLRSMLVTVQIALSIVLLVGTMLLVGSLQNALEANGAVDTNAAIASIEKTPGEFADQLRGLRYHRKVLDAVNSLPGVGAAAWSGALPLARGSVRGIRFENSSGGLSESVDVDVIVTSPEYFATMNVPTLAGRTFDERDRALSQPVAVVNDEFARRYFGGAAVGHRVQDELGAVVEIVGVVAPLKLRTLQDDPQPTMFYPLEQNYLSSLHLTVRTGYDPAMFIDKIRQVLRQADPEVQISRVVTLESYLSEALALDRITTTLMGACGVIALGLALIGVYGVMADAVVRRTREIGVRVALGARPLQIVRLVFAQVLELTAAGVVGGVSVAVGVMHLMAWLLEGIAPLGAATIALIPIGLAIMVVIAALVPASRALRVSPTEALRQE
jgi:putative ABC transport system permease protein